MGCAYSDGTGPDMSGTLLGRSYYDINFDCVFDDFNILSLEYMFPRLRATVLDLV